MANGTVALPGNPADEWWQIEEDITGLRLHFRKRDAPNVWPHMDVYFDRDRHDQNIAINVRPRFPASQIVSSAVRRNNSQGGATTRAARQHILNFVLGQYTDKEFAKMTDDERFEKLRKIDGDLEQVFQNAATENARKVDVKFWKSNQP